MSSTQRNAALVAIFIALTAIGFGLARAYGPQVDPAVATPARTNVHEIELALPDLDGTATRLDKWRDGPMLINFWATWCPPCRKEIPLLKALQDEHTASGLTIVGIALDEVDAVTDYAASMEINYPILIGDEFGSAVSSSLGIDVMALPISVFVDRNGAVTRIHSGEIHREDAEFALAEVLGDI